MHTDESSGDPPPTDLPKVILKKRRALPFFSRHPWVFAGAIDRVEGARSAGDTLSAGDEVQLLSDRGKFIARGLYNPQSNIRVRLYSWRQDHPIDDALISQRLDEAIHLRDNVLNLAQPRSACRLVFSEADGLSGLVVDRYDNWLVVQLTSLALAARKESIIEMLGTKLSPTGIWLRTEKGIRDAEGLEIADGLLAGEPPPRPLFLEERGVKYGVDIAQGQKTGFYIDQRDNRAAFARYTARRKVLDVFCYSGGFGLAALVSGEATHVHGIDASEAALKIAAANAERNHVAERMRWEQGDAFKILERLRDSGERFGAVVLDPPKMARRRSAVPAALKGYTRLNRLAIQLLETDGILVTCSCSGLVSRLEFEAMLAKAAVEEGCNLQILEDRGASADHPTSVFCPENNYLKCYLCRVV